MTTVRGSVASGQPDMPARQLTAMRRPGDHQRPFILGAVCSHFPGRLQPSITVYHTVWLEHGQFVLSGVLRRKMEFERLDYWR